MIFGFSFGPLAYEKSCQFGALYKDLAIRNGCGFIDCADLNFTFKYMDGLHTAAKIMQKLADVVAAKIREMLEH